MKSNVAKNTGAYVLATMIPMAVNFVVLLPIYTRYLSPADYGILALVNVLCGVLLCFSGWQIASSLGRHYFDYSHEDQRVLFSSLLYTIIALNLAMLIPFHFFGEPITEFLFRDNAITYRPYILLVLFTVFFNGITTCCIFMMRTEERGGYYLILAILHNLAGLAFGLYFVVVKDLKAHGALLGTTCALGVYALMLIFANRNSLRAVYDAVKVKAGLRFSIPLIPQSLGSILFIYSDKYILSFFVNNSAIGLYDMGNRFATVYQTGGSSFKDAYSPVFMRRAIEDKTMALATFRTVITRFVVIFGFIFLGLAMFSEEAMILLLAEPFHDAYKFVPILLAAYFFHGLMAFPLHSVRFAEKTKVLPIGTLLAGGFNVGANLLLIPHYGVMVAAWTTLASFIIHFLFLLWASNRYYRLSYEWKEILSVIVLASGIFLTVQFLKTDVLVYNLGIKCTAILMFSLIMWKANYAGISDEAKTFLMKRWKTL